MKIKIEFDTDSELFDQCELNRYLNANKMAHCLDQIANKLRSWYKYDNRGEIPIQEVYDEIWDIIQEEVSMEDLGY